MSGERGMGKDDVAASLEALEAANTRLAERMRWPLWRHMAAGLMVSLLLAAITIQPSPLGFLLFGLALILTLAILRDDRRRHGMFVSGYQRGRTGWVMCVIVALFIGSVVVVETQIDGSPGAPLLWLVVIILFVGTTALSLVWERVYRADIRKKLL